jgi:fatty-acyl-CoA synthase
VTCLGAARGESGAEPFESRVARGHAVPETDLSALTGTIRPEDPGMLIYTSGSTERPKGVLHAQRAPVIQAWRFAELMSLDPDDVVWSAQPFFWTAGIAQSLGATLAAGATLVTEEVFDPASALSTIERERASVVHAWPHQEKAMAEHPSAVERDLSCIRKIEFRSPLARLAGIDTDRWGIHSSYGLSETFTLCAALPASAPAEERRACHGRPLPGTDLRIAHPETGKPLGPDQAGEILVRGDTLMLGYWQVAREHALDGEGFFHTGDGGSLDADGRLRWSGRLSNVIKTGGANVSPLEVESAAGGFPGVAATAAVGVAHPTLGEVLVLCVIPTEGGEPDLGALETRLRERLSAYKRPRRILRIEPDEVPKTDTQKLRADALREIALERLTAERAEIEGHIFGD